MRKYVLHIWRVLRGPYVEPKVTKISGHMYNEGIINHQFVMHGPQCEKGAFLTIERGGGGLGGTSIIGVMMIKP